MSVYVSVCVYIYIYIYIYVCVCVYIWFLCLMAYQPWRLFNAKAILLEQLWYYLTHRWEDKGVHAFSKGICPKVNVIAQLELELAYCNSAVRCISHYTTRTPLYMYVYMYVCVYVYMSVCIYLCVYQCIYIYIYILVFNMTYCLSL